MRQRSFIIVATILAATIFGSVAVYAYDSARDDEISNGITPAGIDIGGLEDGAARVKLRRELAFDLERPLKVTYRKRTFTLDPREARVRANVDAMVDRAVEESRSGNVVSRSVRALTGGDVHADIPVRVSYSKPAVARFVRRVKRKLDEPARDATISFTGGAVTPIRGRTGRAVDVGDLREDIRAAISEPASTRLIRARVTVTKPKVTTADLAERYPKVITVNRATKQLRLYVNLKPAKSYTIAVGATGYDTPAGQYQIQDKQVDPTWHVPNREWAGELAGRVIPPGPQNPLKARWMGIYNGAGIHGTSDVGSLGSAASHGCIRMAVSDVVDLFGRVEVGTTVFIS